MNPWPLGDLQTDITMHWVINARGMTNALNPLEHPWNFDSATVAKHRLRAVTRADREICNDGKWRNTSMVDFVGFDKQGNVCFETVGKPRYRWERR